MARSRDWDELQHTWLEWRRHTGQYIRDLYDQLAQLTNQAARLNSKNFWSIVYTELLSEAYRKRILIL